MTVFSEAELRALLQREEGQFLEFKSLWDYDSTPRRLLSRRQVRNMIAESIAAFANADGGTLVLGVDDNGTPSGHHYSEEAIIDFLAVPDRRLRPPVRVNVQRAVLEGQELLVLHVGIAPEAVMGEGIPRMYEEMEDALLPQPEFGVEQAEFRVTLRNEPALNRLSPLLAERREWFAGRVPQLRTHFKTQRTLTNMQYRQLFGLTRYAAVRELRRLVEERFLSPLGARRGAHYLPGPALTQGGEK